MPDMSSLGTPTKASTFSSWLEIPPAADMLWLSSMITSRVCGLRRRRCRSFFSLPQDAPVSWRLVRTGKELLREDDNVEACEQIGRGEVRGRALLQEHAAAAAGRAIGERIHGFTVEMSLPIIAVELEASRRRPRSGARSVPPTA